MLNRRSRDVRTGWYFPFVISLNFRLCPYKNKINEKKNKVKESLCFSRKKMIHAMEIFAGIVLFCLVEVYMQETLVQETELHNELMRPEINPQTEIQPYCRNGKCAGISYREILNLYGGL